MEFRTVTYKRIRNLGNYESETLELSAEIELDDDLDVVTCMLMQNVNRLLRVGEFASRENKESDDENTNAF